MLNINDTLQVPLRELEFSFSRSSGPGGQNVNKVNTKATLRWHVSRNQSLPEDVRERFTQRYRRRLTEDGTLVMHSQRFRDQGRNVADCLHKLRELILAVAEPPRKRKKTRPTKGSKERRLQEKKAMSQKKERRRKPSWD